jgi:hypothetical protein
MEVQDQYELSRLRRLMGAWGAGTFENDAACDWAGDLEAARDLSPVVETLARAIEVEAEILDADVGCEALAACEVVARMKGNWGVRDASTEKLDAWVRKRATPPSKELISQALAAIDRVLTAPSELVELWDESDENADWHGAVADLRARVAG